MTDAIGAGFIYAGLAYAGTGTVPATVANPGPAKGAAFIGPNGDYQVDGTGDVVKTTHTAQRALLLLRTVLGSANVATKLGLNAPIAVDQRWAKAMEQSVEKALSPMVDDSTIRIERIQVTKTSSIRCLVEVTYTVLASGQSEIVGI